MQVTKIIAIAGLNGSGKTAYVNQMRKQLASDKVRYIAFCDTDFCTSTEGCRQW